MKFIVTDYRKYIGLNLDIKVSYSSHRIQGELIEVYSNVLCVQGVTFWGIHVKDILDFEIVQPDFFQQTVAKKTHQKCGAIVTPHEGSIYRPTKGTARC